MPKCNKCSKEILDEARKKAILYFCHPDDTFTCSDCYGPLKYDDEKGSYVFADPINVPPGMVIQGVGKCLT